LVCSEYHVFRVACQSEKRIGAMMSACENATMWKNIILDWLRRGLEKPGKTQRGLAAALGVAPQQISKLMAGGRGIDVDELPILAAYIEEELPPGLLGPLSAPLIPVSGILSAGHWSQPGAGKIVAEQRVPPLPGWSDLPQSAYLVGDDHASTLCPRGSVVTGVPYGQARGAPQDGDVVRLEREVLLPLTGASDAPRVFETTLRKIVRVGDSVALRSLSARPSADLKLYPDDDTVAVTHLVLGYLFIIPSR
jgi:transcriptional regulator with XRE-family HTH domain